MIINTEIGRIKKRLIQKALNKGLWENFGQLEVSKLESKYFDHKYKNDGIWDKIREFDNWCMTFDLSKLRNGLKR